MYLPFFYYLNLILFSRLIFQFKDKPIKLKNLIFKGILESLGLLLFTHNYWLIVILLILLLLNYLNYVYELRSKKLKQVRIIFLTLYIFAFSFLLSPITGMDFNASVFSILSSLRNHNIIFDVLSKTDYHRFNIILLGFLLNLNEVNFVIRLMLEKLDLTPKKPLKDDKGNIDNKEYNAGRIIGILERIIIYFFVLNGNYTAIGFVIAAKGITRFKELEKRSFAEYVLIGTLLSITLAAGIALLIKEIM